MTGPDCESNYIAFRGKQLNIYQVVKHTVSI